MPNATRVVLYLSNTTNPILDMGSATDGGPAGRNPNPSVDEGFANTFSINCYGGGYNSVGEITVQLNANNTVNTVTMKLYGTDASNKNKWWGFVANGGFSNDNDPAWIYITGVTWVQGPGGAPAGLNPPGVTNISGNAELMKDAHPS